MGRPYAAKSRTYPVALPAAPDLMAMQATELLEPDSAVPRLWTISAGVYSTNGPNGQLITFSPAAGVAFRLPTVYLGFDQGKLARPDSGNAFVLPALGSTVNTIQVLIPPNVRVYFNAQGNDGGVAGLAGAFLVVSVFSTALVEAQALAESSGQTKTLGREYMEAAQALLRGRR